jgi:hypothetical protein
MSNIKEEEKEEAFEKKRILKDERRKRSLVIVSHKKALRPKPIFATKNSRLIF